MKEFLVVMIVVAGLLIACKSGTQCTTGAKHSWGAWSNVWENENPFGFMRQERYCNTCNLRQARSNDR